MLILTQDNDKEFLLNNIPSPQAINNSIKSFLLIGEEILFENNNEIEIICKENFSQAEILLAEKQILNNFPEFILLNLPFNSEQLIDFKVWLEKNCQQKIPVFYNERSLDPALYMMLIKNDLVDDIVQIDNSLSGLQEKTEFIKKYNADLDSQKLTSQHQIQGYTTSRSKRIFDIVISIIAIIILSPLFLLIALIIKYESDGPVFYKSLRAGHGFKVFDFYKFRTMEVDADKRMNELSLLNQYSNAKNTPTFFKLRNDPRITKIGLILRNTSLDELPQFFNVLKGDMSIVGNRPLPLYEARTLTTNQMAERFMAPAGITGLWQVSKRGKDDMSAEERIQIDIDYARKHSIKNDLLIMLKTPSALIQKSNV